MSRYICFDVETPNNRNDRMSSIGVCVVENLSVIEQHYTLINPEARFDRFNIALTGITPEMVQDAPTFAQLWSELGPLMKSGLPVAHNAQFDMSVLSKCLRAYDIPFPAAVHYACTCRMSKKTVPWLPDHKLDTICRELMLPLDHHNALSDARACAEILIYCLKKGADIKDFTRGYNLSIGRTIKHETV